MKNLFAISILIFCSYAARAAAVSQLNAEGFAICLNEKLPDIDFNFSIRRNRLYQNDLLLSYLAVYSGRRFPIVGPVAQMRWSENYALAEDMLALRLYEIALTSDSVPSLFPNVIYEEALKICGMNDAFCAGLISHNVLRTLGRSETAVKRDPLTGNVLADYNPDWFKRDQDLWLIRAQKIQEAMISLHRDGSGDRWGDNYHFFGLFTFAFHEMALYQNLSLARLAAHMSQVLNPVLADGAESPEKAAIDRDSINVAAKYFRRSFGSREWNCSDTAAYRLP